MARPRKELTPQMIQQIEEMKSKGASITQICKALNISRSTYYVNFRENHGEAVKAAEKKGEEAHLKDLNEAIKVEIEKKMPELIEAFFKLLTGGKDTELKVTRTKIDGEVVGESTETITTKTIQPNVTLWIFMLKCLFGWAEKSVVEMQGQPENAMSGLTTEELKKLVGLYGKNKNG